MYTYILLGSLVDRPMTSGVSRDTGFKEIRPGAGFETGDVDIEKSSGGATVVRLEGWLATLQIKTISPSERVFCPCGTQSHSRE